VLDLNEVPSPTITRELISWSSVPCILIQWCHILLYNEID
jgi:hypothetical protein